MLIVEFVDGRLIVSEVDAFGRAAGEGVVQGVRVAADVLARDVAEHTPRKTGRAAQSVVVRPSQGGKVQTIAYSGSDRGKRISAGKQVDAYYMRFVILGAKPHTIAPRYKTARGFKRAQWNALKKGRLAPMSRRMGIAFAANGETIIRRAVRHPGVKPQHILSERLHASQGEITTALQDAVRRNVDRAYRERSSLRGARWTGDGWSHEK